MVQHFSTLAELYKWLHMVNEKICSAFSAHTKKLRCSYETVSVLSQATVALMQTVVLTWLVILSKALACPDHQCPEP